MAEWSALEIKIPGKELLEKARSILETLLIFLDIVKAILQTIETFLIDIPNPLGALLKALLALITQLFNALKQTGAYLYYDIPNPIQDPNFTRHLGGYQAFTQRFIGSLYDGKDPSRPQPAPGQTKSGFVIILADVTNVFAFLRLLKILMGFFGKEFVSPKYAPPGNFKVLPAGKKIGSKNAADPILGIAAVFNADLKGLVLEWTPSTTVRPPDAGFSDLVGSVAHEFVPQKFLIEKSSRVGGPLPISTTQPTNFETANGRQIKRTVKCRDEYGDTFKKFEKYIVIDGTSGDFLAAAGTFLEGQAGKFRYIDTEVDPDVQYYYRVRAFSGPLNVDSSGSITLPPPLADTLTGNMIQRWSADTQNGPIMGRPTSIVKTRLPKIPPNFDVIGILENIFLTAFAIGFHMPMDPGAQFKQDGTPLNDLTPASEIGRGTLTKQGGVLGYILPKLPGSPSEQQVPNPVTHEFADVYYNLFLVKQQSRRYAQIVGAAMLDQSAALLSFRSLMSEGLAYPINPPNGTYLSNVTSMSDLVAAFVTLPADFPKVSGPHVYPTYTFGYSDPNFRLNVLKIVRFIKSFTLGGVPPDWVQISILRDLIPWSGQFIYDLIARIEALLAAFKGIFDEIKAFIDQLIRKIEVLERFIQYLISILNFLASFSAGFYVLAVPSTDGGIPDWVNQVENAGGTVPSSGPGGYSGGIVLAYVLPNIDAFASAIGLIF